MVFKAIRIEIHPLGDTPMVGARAEDERTPLDTGTGTLHHALSANRVDLREPFRPFAISSVVSPGDPEHGGILHFVGWQRTETYKVQS